MKNPIIIIGSGLAGYSLAREFRKLNTSTPILIISQESGEAYSKPMLSNAYSQGKTAQSLISAHSDEAAKAMQVKVIANTVVHHINAQEKNIETNQGIFSYESLILALGADPIRPKFEGLKNEHNILSINNLQDYHIFREKLATARRVVILGSGLIGCEFANDLVSKSHHITVIGSSVQPLSPLIPEIAGIALKNKLSKLGVEWHLGSPARDITHHAQGLTVILDNNTKIEADLVFSAIGLRPRISLGAAAGIAVNRGIIVDEFMHTSVPDIYALGDCAEINHQVMPFVAPIMHASRAIAKTLNGELTKVNLPAMPIVIKTSAYPITVLPPPKNQMGHWETLSHDEDGLKQIFIDNAQKIHGFILAGDKTGQRMAMMKMVETA